MVIKRVFNNNVAMVTSDDGAELIVIGRGLCFGRHAGDVVDSSSVEKTYALCESTANDARALDRLSSLIETIPVINLAISEDIVEMLREELDVNVDDAILIALADHITLALDRERKGVPCDNPLLLEIQQFYRKEYGLAGRALQIIKDYLGIQMSDEERGFITLHIVNATMLAQRALDPKVGQAQDDVLFLIERNNYPKAFSCSEAIADHLLASYGVSVTDAEKSYLAYHIVNLLGEPGPRA